MIAAAGLVDLVHNALPTGQAQFVVKAWHIRVARRGKVIRVRALSNDEASPALGAAAIIGGHILAGYLSRRMAASHGCHHNSVLELSRTEGERAEERFDRDRCSLRDFDFGCHLLA